MNLDDAVGCTCLRPHPALKRELSPGCPVHGRPPTPGMTPWRAATYIAGLRGQFGQDLRMRELARTLNANLRDGRNPL